MSSEDDVYVFKIKAHAIRHVFLGTIMIINVLIWFVCYPIRKQHPSNKTTNDQKKSKFYLSKIYGIFIIAQCNVCWSSIVWSQIERGFISDFSKFVSCLALTTIFVCRILMSIDIYLGSKMKSFETRKKWIFKYGIIGGVIIFIIQILICFIISFDAGSASAYVLLLISMILFLISLYILLNSANKYGQGKINTFQLKVIIGCQTINFVLSVATVLTSYGEMSSILGFTGIFGYLCFTMLLESGIVSILDHLSMSQNENGDYVGNVDNANIQKSIQIELGNV